MSVSRDASTNRLPPSNAEPHHRFPKHSRDDRTDRHRQHDDRPSKRHAPGLKEQGVVDAGGTPYSGPPIHNDRYSQIALDNSLDINKLRLAWGGSRPDVRSQLFDAATGVPLFILSLDIWRPLIRAYFSWYNIPRERCTDIWGDIIDMFLRLPNHHTVDAEFRAWAFGCLGMFYLEDRQRRRREEPERAPPHMQSREKRDDLRSPTSPPPPPRADVYDPESNWMQTMPFK